MLAVVALPCERQPLAVVAHIDIEDADAEREAVDDLGVLQVAVQAHDGLCAAVREQTVEAVVGVVVDDVVDALELLLLDHLLPLDVIRRQAAHLGIVGGIDDAMGIGVERHVGGIVELYAVDVFQAALLAGLQVYLRQVGKVARSVHGGVGLAGGGVVDQRRHGA